MIFFNVFFFKFQIAIKGEDLVSELEGKIIAYDEQDGVNNRYLLVEIFANSRGHSRKFIPRNLYFLVHFYKKEDSNG